MYLIEIFLPLYAPDGTPYPSEVYDELAKGLTETFGGVTLHKRAPAKGLWKASQVIIKDDIVIFEVMAEKVSRPYWKQQKHLLKQVLGQDEIVIRISEVELI